MFWIFAELLLIDLLWRRERPQNASEAYVPLVGCGVLLQWLLWATATTGGFLYYMLPITPFFAVLVARELDDWWNEPLSRWLAVAYLGLLGVCLWAFWPFLTAAPVSPGYFERLFFLSTWR